MIGMMGGGVLLDGKAHAQLVDKHGAELPAGVRRWLEAVAGFDWGGDGFAWPSVAAIAAKLRSSRSTAQLWRRQAVAAGWAVCVQTTGGARGSRRNVYALTVPWHVAVVEHVRPSATRLRKALHKKVAAGRIKAKGATAEAAGAFLVPQFVQAAVERLASEAARLIGAMPALIRSVRGPGRRAGGARESGPNLTSTQEKNPRQASAGASQGQQQQRTNAEQPKRPLRPPNARARASEGVGMVKLLEGALNGAKATLEERTRIAAEYQRQQRRTQLGWQIKRPERWAMALLGSIRAERRGADARADGIRAAVNATKEAATTAAIARAVATDAPSWGEMIAARR